MSALQVVMVVYALLLGYFVTLQVSYMVLLGTGVVANRRRAAEYRVTDVDRIAASELTVPLSVLIPAYNERHSLLATVRSVLDARFPELEVIVIDDGSTDGTLELVRRAFDLVPHHREPRGDLPTAAVRRVYRSRTEPRLWVVHKENGGKGDAANAGLNMAVYRFVVLTDGDGVFEADGLLRIIRLINFAPGRIIGLGGTLRPLNGCEVRNGIAGPCTLPHRWVERFQLLEYTSAFLGSRLGWSALNAVPVLSGGMSAWRRDALETVGGFSSTTTHEDLDTTLRLHHHFRGEKLDYHIAYVPDTVARTEVPHTWRGLYAQRKRWQRAVFESVWRERSMILNPRYGTVGMLLMPHLLIYDALGPFIELISYVLTIVLLVLGVVDPGLLVAFLLTAAGLVATMRLAALLLDLTYYEDRSKMDIARLGVTALFEYWWYRPFLVVARTHAFIEFVRGHRGHERAQRRADTGRPSIAHAGADTE